MAAEGWEVVTVPSEIKNSTRDTDRNKLTQGEGDKEDEGKSYRRGNDDRLCGYLQKFAAKGILKTWKQRWFVFEPRRCILYYYRTPNDCEPLGNIDVANASFSYSPDAANKGQFEISVGDRCYQLQAQDKVTMMFWLQQLQGKRREFNRLKTHHSSDSRPSSSYLRPESGLLGEEEEGDTTEDEAPHELLTPIQKPASIEQPVVADNNSGAVPGWNFSFTNLRTEIRNWRKSSTPFGEPINTSPKESSSRPHSQFYGLEDSPTSSPPTSRSERQGKYEETKQAGRSVDFGFTKLVAALKRRSMWSPVISGPVTNPPEDICPECNETKAMVGVLKEAVGAAEKEITTRDEVIQSLHEQLRYAVTNRPETRKLSEESEVSEQKDEYISQLTKMMKRLTEENEALKSRITHKENRVSELEQQMNVLREMISAKDNAIVSLTNQIFAFEHPEKAEEVVDETCDISESQSESEAGEPALVVQLQEACDAYMAQNRFLNSEILEMNKLRKNDQEAIKGKESQLTALEAELCKIKSRYVLLLKEFSSPLRGGVDDTRQTYELVEHLLDDAINTDASLEGAERPKEPRSYDRYGFYDVVDKEDEESLQSLADKLDERSEDAEYGSQQMSVGVKWENFLVAQGKKPIIKSEEIKNMVRSGIPHEFRARVWLDLINHYVRQEREMAGPGYYRKLLKDKQDVYTPAKKQIELDLLRTLPNNKFYDRVDSEGTTKLRQVLLAYSWHNPSVGYCQGLNRLGAIALLYLKEEDAFWCLIAIIDHLMPRDYYTRTLLGAQVDQRVLKDLLEEKAPKLYAHFISMQVDLSLISFNWLLTVFVDIFPIELTLRVWDSFLYEGNKVLFRYALAVFKSCEEDLLKQREPGGLYGYFRRLPVSKVNPQRITVIAFQQLNPFPRRGIIAKRARHKPVLVAELEEFELLRRDYRSNSIVGTDDCEAIFSEGEEED